MKGYDFFSEFSVQMVIKGSPISQKRAYSKIFIGQYSNGNTLYCILYVWLLKIFLFFVFKVSNLFKIAMFARVRV